MGPVIDASIAAAWFLPDESNDLADALMASLRAEPGQVPSLFWFETRALFVMAERRGRLAPGDALKSMEQLRGLPIHDMGAAADRSVISLAFAHGLTGYDATYLALAFASGAPLATLDARLARAARDQGVALYGAT